MAKIKQLFLYYRARTQTVIAVALLAILAAVSVFHFFLFNMEMDNFKEQIAQNDQTYTDIKWKVIDATLRNSDFLADVTAKNVSENIVADIDRQYPNKEVLRNELEQSKELSPKFSEILVNNIENRFLFNINSYDNGLFIMEHDRIIADMNPNTIDLGKNIDGSIVDKDYNPVLYRRAMDTIVRQHDSSKLIFYEPVPNSNPDHLIISEMKLSALHDVYVKEGLEGLSSYVFLAPYYITNKGDIFGTPDYTNKGFTNNHKLIVVQRFNITDILQAVHPGLLDSIDKERDAIDREIHSQMSFKAITYLATLGVNILALFCVIFFLSATHRKNRYPRWEQLSEKLSKRDE